MRPSNLPPFVPAHVRTSSSPQRISYVYMPAHRRGSRGSVDLLSLSGEGSASQASFGVGMERPSGMALHSDAGSSRARIVNVNGGGIVAGGSTGGEATGSSETDSTHSSNVPKTSDSGRIGRLQADAMSMVSDSFGTITPRESVFGLVGGPTAAAVVTPRESVQSNATVRAASQPIPLSAGMAGVGAGGSKPTGQHPRSTSRASRMWKVWSPNVASPTSPSPSASSVDVQSQSVYTGTQSGVQSGRTTALSTYSNATGVANVTVGRNGASEGGEGISRSSSLARGGSSLGRSVGFAVAEGSSKEKSRKEKDIEKERKEGGGTKLKKKRKIPFFEMVAPAVGGTKE
ncbi:hypothetical protein BKA70DRAFT_1270386 [Coprinopsis sp. MPI-PUGE-AT-0042]|nr:hypothetical protein BKA70DRAFT_1270386 [Coprinopsis sp. MPI-PUGE-AT-0042]